jgi:hypothetical protein
MVLDKIDLSRGEKDKMPGNIYLACHHYSAEGQTVKIYLQEKDRF